MKMFVTSGGTFSATIVALMFIMMALAGAAQAQSEDSSKETATGPTIGSTELPKRMEPVSEEPIKLVHVLNPGEREYLSPNLIGVQNIAMTFLPLSMNFINVIDAYREIVNGVRYEIHLNAVDTKSNNEEIICRLVILEKPWIRTEWGDKYRELVTSNCTSGNNGGIASDDPENNLTLQDPAERSKALNDKYPKNAIFNGGTRNELNNEQMAHLESQIVPTKEGGNADGNGNNRRRAATTTTTTTTTENVAVAGTTAASESNEAEVVTAKPAINVNAIPVAPAAPAAAANDNDNEATTKTPELSDNEKQWLDDILSVGAYNFEKTIQANKADHKEAEQVIAESKPNDDAAAIDSNVNQPQLYQVEVHVQEDGPQQQQQQEGHAHPIEAAAAGIEQQQQQHTL